MARKKSGFDDSIDLVRGNYKDALDLAIKKSLKSSDKSYGPFRGRIIKVLKLSDKRVERDLKRSKSTVKLNSSRGYLVRLLDGMDDCLPEPLFDNSEEDNKTIQLYSDTIYLAPEEMIELEIGQEVLVDFSEVSERKDPIIVSISQTTTGEIPFSSFLGSIGSFFSPKKSFGRCSDSGLQGEADGSSLGALEDYTDGIKNFFIGDDPKVEDNSTSSTAPKITYPRGCLIRSSTADRLGISNEPDNQEEADNLTFLQEEVIPRLLPFFQSLNPNYSITSIYRSDAVNRAIGGSPNSRHSKGLGVDFGGLMSLPFDERNKEFFRAVEALKAQRQNFPWLRTVIVETFRNHIHIDVYAKNEGRGPIKFRKWTSKNSKMEDIG